MTATEIMPVLIDSATTIISALGNAEIFDGISALEIMLGIFAIDIIGDFVAYLRGASINSEVAYKTAGASRRSYQMDDSRHYR